MVSVAGLQCIPRSSSAQALSVSFCLLVSVLLAGCSTPPPEPDVASAALWSAQVPAARPPATDDGLVVARHPHCDVGSTILHYLQTGDNQGSPGLDQRFAVYVHVSLPQARALADQYIESCDQNIDRQEAAAQQAALRNAQLEEQQAEQAQRLEQQRVLVHARELAACNAIGGRLGNDRCSSVVKGNPSGEPGADCVLPDGTPIWLSFTKYGEFFSGFYSTTKNDYPGCFK